MKELKLTSDQFLKIASAIANANRIKMIETMANTKKGASFKKIHEDLEFAISQPTMFEYMQILKKSELVYEKKDKNNKSFSINIDVLEQFNQYIILNILIPAVNSNQEVIDSNSKPIPDRVQEKINRDKLYYIDQDAINELIKSL